MSTKSLVKRAAVLALWGASSALTFPAYGSDGECGQWLRIASQTNIAEFVDQSEFIGIYTAVDAMPIQVEGVGDELFLYTMTAHLPIKGAAPTTMELVGRRPHTYAPEHYFAALRRYDHLTPESDVLFGSTAWVENPDGNCVLRPRFVLGYTYLIVEGEISGPASYEPVLDITQNNLVRIVREQATSDVD